MLQIDCPSVFGDDNNRMQRAPKRSESLTGGAAVPKPGTTSINSNDKVVVVQNTITLEIAEER